MAVIYQITNMENGKYYIGSAESFEQRVWQHKNYLKRGVHKNPRLQAAWNKYGADVFVFEILEVVPEGSTAFEIENIYLHKCVGLPNCYNVNTDAIGMRTGIPHTEASKAQLSANRKGKHAGAEHYRYGKEVSPEVREKIGAAQRGIKKAPRTYTPEGRAIAQETMRRNAREQVHTAFAEVHAKFPLAIREKYDFSNAVYVGALVRIEGCVCPIHGVFSQYAARFRKGRGCPLCGAVQRIESKSVQMKDAWSNEVERAKMLAARKKK
jgi:group I intron endonuclease